MVQCEACGVSMVVPFAKIAELGEVCKLCGQPPGEFELKVLQLVKVKFSELTKASELIVMREARALQSEGFGALRASRILQCIEEVNPDLDEVEALRRMRKLRKNVQ